MGFYYTFFNIRIHHFLRSDDKRYFHDHAWDFWTFVLKGYYYDVSPLLKETDESKQYQFYDKSMGEIVIRRLRSRFNLYKVSAEHRHYVHVPKNGCWTLVFNLQKRRNWGFWVNGKFKRPLKYFYKFGHPPCDEQ